MSRGVRDLRDLICVSRLTIRDSDEEIPYSDEESPSVSSHDNLSLSSGADSRQSSAQSKNGTRSRLVTTPDSGIGTNGWPASPETDPISENASVPQKIEPRPPSTTMVGGMRRKKKKKRKVLDTVPPKHELPKSNPLPPLSSMMGAFELRRSSSSSSESGAHPESMHPAAHGLAVGDHYAATHGKPGNFDEVLTYFDATVVSEWLTIANTNVTELSTWCHEGDNFIQFAHFWLSNFPDLQKQEIFRLEYSITLDQLSFAFTAGRDSGQVKHKDLLKFLDAVFREYPGRLFSSKGPHMFLDYLDILSSERQSLYKRLLSDVKVSTRIKQHAQWCLAARSFVLVSVWFAVVNFYRRLIPGKSSQSKALPIPPQLTSKQDPSLLRLNQAIRSGYVDVINYLLKTGKVSEKYKDGHNRSLIFSAVMYNQPEVLQYLIKQTEASKVINEFADTGNTALHAAANSGNNKLVSILLAAPGIQLDAQNSQCDGATPLHLGTMHGHAEVVKLLLKAGADRNFRMDTLTAENIAQEFGHEDLMNIFSETRS